MQLSFFNIQLCCMLAHCRRIWRLRSVSAGTCFGLRLRRSIRNNVCFTVCWETLLQMVVISAVVDIQSRWTMHGNLLSPLESMRHGRLTSDQRLVVSHPYTTFDMCSQELKMNGPLNSPFLILISQTPSQNDFTFLKSYKSAAFFIKLLIVLCLKRQCLAALYTPTSATNAQWFCSRVSPLL